jgi:hypothetical protein
MQRTRDRTPPEWRAFWRRRAAPQRQLDAAAAVQAAADDLRALCGRAGVSIPEAEALAREVECLARDLSIPSDPLMSQPDPFDPASLQLPGPEPKALLAKPSKRPPLLTPCYGPSAWT